MSKVDKLPQRPRPAWIVYVVGSLIVSAPIFFTENHSMLLYVCGAVFFGANAIAAALWVRDYRRYDASVRAGEQPRYTTYPDAPNRI
jgi:hypothetical protein